MSLVKNVIDSLKWGLSFKVITQILSWFVTIYVIRLLTPDDYGMLALVDMSMALFMMLGTLGIGGAIIKNQAIQDNKIQALLAILIIINVLLFLIVVSISSQLSIFFSQEGLRDALLLSSILFLTMPYITIYSSLLARELKFKILESINFITTIIQFTTNLILAIYGFGFWSIIIGQLTGNICTLIFLLFQKKKILKPSFDFKDSLPLIIDSKNNFFTAIIWQVNEKIDRFLISKIVGNQILGIYSMSNALVEKPVSLAGSLIQTVGLASFSKLHHDKNKVGEYIVKSTSVMAIMVIPVFFGIASIAPDLVPFVLGKQWTDAVLPIQILSMVQIINMLKINIGSALFAMGYAKRKIYHALVAFLIIALSWSIGLSFGFIEGCYSYLFGYFLWFLWHLIDSKTRLSINLQKYFYSLLLPLFISMMMFLIVRFVDDNFFANTNVIIQLFIQILVGFISYLSLLFIFNKKQMMFVKNLLLIKG
ncbi:MAG: oligosaccharide flippase family protein [Pseudomonadota bacterium]